MKSFSLILWICFILSIVLLVESSDPSELTKIKELSELRTNGLIAFRDRTYRKYVKHGPRNYHLFLLYTVFESQFDCTICRELYPQYQLLAENYLQNQKKEDVPIFFGVVDFSKNKQAFQLHGFTSVPNLAYIPPQYYNDDEDGLTTLEFSDEDLYPVIHQSRTAEAFTTFVLQKTGIKVEIYHSPIPLILGGVFSLIIFGISVRLLLTYTDIFLSFLYNKNVWFLVSMLAYGLSISGMVYCVINNSSPYELQSSGKVSYFSSRGDDQYVAEGLIVAIYNFFIAFGLISMTKSADILRKSFRLTALACSLGFFVVASIFLYQAYVFKNGWYAYRSWYDT